MWAYSLDCARSWRTIIQLVLVPRFAVNIYVYEICFDEFLPHINSLVAIVFLLLLLYHFRVLEISPSLEMHFFFIYKIIQFTTTTLYDHVQVCVHE